MESDSMNIRYICDLKEINEIVSYAIRFPKIHDIQLHM